VVIIDHNSDVLFDMGTINRNDPFLTHKPQVMALAYMDEPLVRQVCSTHSIAIFNGQSAMAYHLAVVPQRSPPGLIRLRQLLAELKCGVTMPVQRPS
jgi:hypothetical protein